MANPIITKIQIEGNNVVSFLNGTNYVRSMSQILPQSPTYISYRYDTITISQVAGEPFTFSIYTVTDVGGNAFTELTIQDAADVVQARTVEVYRLLVTSIFKGCCPCGDEVPQCAIQYVVGDPEAGAPLAGEFVYSSGSPGTISFNYITDNNQDFTNFFPTVQDGSWIFLFSKTDPTVYAIVQVSGFTDQVTYVKFEAIELNAAGLPFPIGTIFCVDFTSVGGSLVQGWQDTLNISSLLTQDNTVDGGGFDFVFDNNNSFTINGPGGSVEVDVAGPSLNAGSQQILVTSGYIDIITPSYASASTGWVLALTAGGHVEYVEAGTGTISSIELIMPPAFTVSDPNPLTTDGTFTVTVEGTEDQYINGLGELADFPVYTVENGLHAFGGVPGEAPPDPFLFHLGGLLVEDTTITVTNGANQYALGVAGLAAQNTQQPFGVSNLGDGGVATFQDYGSGNRPNPSVEIVGDVDLFQPLLELKIEGNLPAGGILTDRNALLRLKYDGDPSLASMSIDYQFKNDDTPPNVIYFVGCRLTAEVTDFNANNEQSKFLMQLFDGGLRQTKMEMSGPGQLTLNEYATGSFSNGATNINNALSYVLGVDNTGKVWKTSAGTGTVTSINGAGLITTSPNPITTIGTVTTNMATNRLVGRYSPGSGIMQEITIGAGLALSAGGELTADGTVPVYSVANGLHTQESPPDSRVFHLGGGLIENTIIYNQGNDFTVERADNGVALTVNNTSTGVGTFQNAIKAVSPNGLAGDFYAGNDFYNIDEIEPVIKINRTTAIPSDPTSYFNEIGGSIDFINPTVVGSLASQVPYSSRIASRWTKSLNQGGFSPARPVGRTEIWNYDNGAQRLTATFNAGTYFSGGSTSRGLVQFNQYGQGNFYGLLTPVYGLGVDDQGNIIEVDLGGGGGGTYDGNQGIYKDTSLTNDTFMLGAPSGSQAGIAFSIDRYIDTSDQFLQIEGANGEDGSVVLKVIEGSGIPIDTKASFISATQYKKYAGSFTGHFSSALLAYSTADGNTLQVTNAGPSGLAANFQSDNGGGIQILSLLGNQFQINGGSSTTPAIYPILDLENLSNLSPAANGEGVSITMSPGSDAVGQIDVGVSLNAVVSDIGTVVGNDSVVDFRVDTLNLGTVQQHTSFIGSGQLQLHEYTTATAFDVDSGPSIGVLNVDNTGKVFVGDGGGGGGGIPFAIASGTDTYTATVAGVTGYTDGDAYIIRFTNGNTDQSTLNISGNGAKILYKNNDGPLIGGDVWDGAEMICIYNLAIDGFSCIGSSPNSLYAYVTNVNGSTITRGQAVVAFGGTGNRMTVKLAQANNDANSAQTIGFVFSTSIANNQKGIIIIQGYFTGLSLFPTATWADGDPVYLSPTTPGAVTKTKPYAPSHLVYLGIVATANNGSSGRMYVRIQNGFELDELHNVQAQSPSLNDTLWYDSSVSPGQWKTASIPTILGYTPVSTTRTISTTAPLAGGGDLSADRTLSIADAAADGATKGAAAFTAADFNSAGGVISIDYDNAQKASASQPGFLTAADWSTFNGKQNSIGLTTVGTNLATLPNPSAIRYLRVNADNTVSALSASQLITDLGIINNIQLFKDFSVYSVVNTSTNTLFQTYAIAANSLQVSDFIEILAHFNSTQATGTLTYRLYINTAANLTGATLLGTVSPSLPTGNIYEFSRQIAVTAIGTSGNFRLPNVSGNIIASGNLSVATSNITVNTTVIQYLMFAAQMSVTTATTTQQMVFARINR